MKVWRLTVPFLKANLWKAIVLTDHNKRLWPGLFNRFVGLISFGTPFRGAMGMSHGAMVTAANEVLDPSLIEPRLLDVMQPGNESLTELLDDFGWTWSNRARITCFYELQASELGDIIGNRRRRVCSKSFNE